MLAAWLRQCVRWSRYIAEHNTDPKPFTWTKTPAQILAKLTPMYASVH
jgi:hypothetical protein